MAKDKGKKVSELPKQITINKVGDFGCKWYSEMHGQTFDVVGFYGGLMGYEVDYKTKDLPVGTGFFIQEEHCTIIKPKKDKK